MDMREFYNRFLRNHISLEPLGILPWGEQNETYFCTPKGALPIGCTGVDGIHYCFVRGCGETVFVVNPMNGPGEFVHPVGRSFEEFLGLLAACRGEAALEQSWMWDREKFRQFLEQDEPGEGWQETVKALEDKLGVLPEQDPFACLQEIREEVDCSRLQFPAEYYDLIPEEEPEPPRPWEVRFANREGRPGQEIPLHRWMRWADRDWYIPSVYSCSKGMVVDFCLKAPVDRVAAWMDRWGITRDREDGGHLTEAEQQQARNESPMSFEFDPVLVLNGKDLHWKNGSGSSWCGCLPGYEEYDFREGEDWMEHYELERTCGWSFFRYSFPWTGSRKPKKLNMLFLGMKQEPVERYAEPFTLSGAGEEVTLTNPSDGHTYCLRAEALYPEQAEMDWGDDRDYPTRCWQLDYTVSPSLSPEQLQLRDCAEGDRPVSKPDPEPDCHACLPESRNDEVLALIGGADGPTAVAFMSTDQGPDCRTAISSLRFELPEQVTWQPVFRGKEYPDGMVQLI